MKSIANFDKLPEFLLARMSCAEGSELSLCQSIAGLNFNYIHVAILFHGLVPN